MKIELFALGAVPEGRGNSKGEGFGLGLGLAFTYQGAP